MELLWERARSCKGILQGKKTGFNVWQQLAERVERAGLGPGWGGESGKAPEGSGTSEGEPSSGNNCTFRDTERLSFQFSVWG